MNTELLNNKRVPVIDVQGRQRGYKIWVICPVCEQGRWVSERATRLKSFSGMCQKCHPKFTTGLYDEHSRWQGGRMVEGKKQYILIKLRNDDFFYPMAKKSGYVYEHRLVIAKHLNRCLVPWEIVHHKNGVRADNRLENLELLPIKKFHIVDSYTKSLIKRQEDLIHKLQVENSQLQNQLNL